MKVTAIVTDTVPIRAACLLQRSPEFFKKAVPLPGVSLALVGCSTGSCTLVGNSNSSHAESIDNEVYVAHNARICVS